MTKTSRILITGATGKVGRHLVAELQRRGASLRAAAHSRDKAAAIAGPDTEVVDFDFDDPQSITAALDGIDTLALLTPPDARQVDWAIQTIDLAKQAGVSRIVRLSVLAAAMEPGIRLGRWHRTVERYLQASDLDWTIVRPGPFMQNFLGMYPRADVGFALPAGDAPVNHIDVADVGRALAEVIDGSGHDGRVYLITGGQPMTMAETVSALSAAGAQELRYADISPHEARKRFLDAGRPAWFVDILLELFGAFRTGAVGLQTSAFEDLVGRPPRTIEQFAAQSTAA